MAIINCPECGKEISDKAPHCVHCGCPIQNDDIRNIEKERKKKANLKISRKKVLIIVAVILVLLIVAVPLLYFGKNFSDSTSSIEKAGSSVVKITCTDYYGNELASGSGFVAFDSYTVVTNYHVISQGFFAEVTTDNNDTIKVDKVIAYSKENDIAIVSLERDSNIKPLKLAKSEVKKGETVIAIGSPLGIKNSVSQGIVSGYVEEDGMNVLQFTAAISSGSSGGALFNDRGKVIGVTYASYEDGQNLNLAIPIEYVKNLYAEEHVDEWVHNLYFAEYPYMKEAYKLMEDAEPVTIDELMINPSNYLGKEKIYVEAYFSSGDIESDGYCYISDEENIGDIAVMSVYDTEYISDNFACGDKVFLLGNLTEYNGQYIFRARILFNETVEK